MIDEKLFEQLRDEELHAIDRLSSIPIVLFDATDVFYMNAYCRRLLGYDVIGQTLTDLPRISDFFDLENFQSTIQSILNDNAQLIRQEITLTDKLGNKLWLEYYGKIVIYKHKKCILASLVDITDKKRLQLDLSRVSRVRELMLEVTQSILQTDGIEDLFELIMKNALKSMQKGSLGSILVKEANVFKVASSIGFSDDIKDFILPYEDAFLYKVTNGKMNRIVNIPDLLDYEKYHPVKTAFGEKRYIKSTITAPIYIKGSFFGMINIDSVETNAFDEDDVKTMEFIRNHTQIALANHLLFKEKAFQAKHDALTHLYNRFYFKEQFEESRARALKYDETFNIVLFDIDGLKAINDHHGHLAGDQVIRRIAAEMDKDIRKSDLVARMGGDEFIGLFFNSSRIALTEKVQGILTRLKKEPIMINDTQIVCSFSYGIASFPAEGLELDDLISKADERMYTFKRSMLD